MHGGESLVVLPQNKDAPVRIDRKELFDEDAFLLFSKSRLTNQAFARKYSDSSAHGFGFLIHHPLIVSKELSLP
jgi:hypothetical protein